MIHIAQYAESKKIAVEVIIGEGTVVIGGGTDTSNNNGWIGFWNNETAWKDPKKEELDSAPVLFTFTNLGALDSLSKAIENVREAMKRGDAE